MAKRYKKRFGYYPKAILADKIYQTKENRAFCKKRGIRLSGPPLGRPKKNSEKKRNRLMYKDACERNAIEGTIGNAKRKYGLDLIKCKLEETSKTALVILARNAVRRILRTIFEFFHIELYFCGFVAC